MWLLENDHTISARCYLYSSCMMDALTGVAFPKTVKWEIDPALTALQRALALAEEKRNQYLKFKMLLLCMRSTNQTVWHTAMVWYWIPMINRESVSMKWIEICHIFLSSKDKKLLFGSDFVKGRFAWIKSLGFGQISRHYNSPPSSNFLSLSLMFLFGWFAFWFLLFFFSDHNS